MTYLTFHLIFTLPLTVVLALTLPPRAREGFWQKWSVPLLALMAFFYTLPWDNYLVWKGIWFYGPDRVLGTWFYVPWEEYFFFLIQPFMAGYWLLHLLHRFQEPLARPKPSTKWYGVGTFSLLTLVGIGLLVRGGSGTYMGLILAWASPVAALQWGVAGEKFSALPKTFVAAVLPITLYLWIADRTAIDLGIWTISTETSFDLSLFGLPIEEATFFLMTNVLVIQGVLMLLNLQAIKPSLPRPA